MLEAKVMSCTVYNVHCTLYRVLDSAECLLTYCISDIYKSTKVHRTGNNVKARAYVGSKGDVVHRLLDVAECFNPGPPPGRLRILIHRHLTLTKKRNFFRIWDRYSATQMSRFKMNG
jgi:hypothetical protein